MKLINLFFFQHGNKRLTVKIFLCVIGTANSAYLPSFFNLNENAETSLPVDIKKTLY